MESFKMEDFLRTKYVRDILTSRRKLCYFLAGLTLAQFILFTLINHALYICTCLSPSEAISPAFAVGSPTAYTGWERVSLQEMLTDKSPIKTCPDTFFRYQESRDVTPFVTEDETRVISLLKMVNI